MNLAKSTPPRSSASTPRDFLLELDELVRAVKGAHNGLLDLEELNEAEIEAFRKKYLQLAEEARDEIRRAHADTGTPEIQFPS